MMAFGDQLKEAREAQGVSLEAVAEATRIIPRHLAALERSDLEGLPRGPFGRGYVRAYAEFLGIDPQPVLEAYHSQERQHGLGPSATQRRTVEELSQLMRERSRAQRRGLTAALGGGALVLVALGVLGTGGWLLIGREAPAPSPPAAEATVERPEAGAAPVSAPAETRTLEQPRAAPSPVARTPNPELRVSHSGVGTAVEDRRLVGRADRFVEGTEVSFWTRVLGGRPGDEIRHFWFHEGRVAMRADLAIGGSHWRTHSRLELPRGSTGPWTVEARDLAGRILAREEFLCVSGEPQRP
jgi:transcriptional regulator with XRE-family HTH domain